MQFQNRYKSGTDRPRWEKTPDGFLRCKARVLAERIMPYSNSELGSLPENTPDVINMLVSFDSMSSAESLRSLEGAPVVIGDHNWVTPDNIKQFGVGQVAGTPILDGPYVVCDLLITDPDAIHSIESGENSEISAAYLADTIFESGEWDGQSYDAKQTQLRYNHIAVIPAGHGRAGSDVKIINKKDGGAEKMADETKVRVQLKNTGKFLNVGEEEAGAIGAEQEASSKKLEDTMNELESKNSDMAALQAEIEELKGELSVYKEKLDTLLSTEAVEHAAAGMIEEAGEAGSIVENMPAEEGATEEQTEQKKEEVMNSIKGIYGPALHEKVLTACGIKCENMTPEAMRGAFKAQAQIANSMKGRKTIAGTKVLNGAFDKGGAVVNPQLTPHQRLGYKK